MRASERVFVSLDWSDALPKQETVALEFWTNSNDQCGAMCDVQKDFIRSFVSLAEVRREVSGAQTAATSELIRLAVYLKPKPSFHLHLLLLPPPTARRSLRARSG